ncbi:molybdate transport system regulatory protein [Desulfuromusa kysingii]|uniref:Molybdate transport system regulatory protein n=1 Tax=Desulfuromusa kysingii TaxID=37625 RepID=A0A1H4DIU8_9BACT|nr:TOBE domain-containing protein [Desulfuromusa kysingii]SEA72497.1 molybdate transport system regulatory protein [Desulfuromusa kysingii]
MTECNSKAETLQMLGFVAGKNRGIALLEAVATCGSINKAAQQLKMSYKAAWQQLEKLNNIVDAPLLERSVGGRGGGGATLTAAGINLLQFYRKMEHEYGKFLQFINEETADTAAMFLTLRRMEMKVSARNVWSGKVESISDGAVNAVVKVALRGGDKIVAVITRESTENLGLSEGSDVIAMVKSSSVLLARDLNPEQISARNILSGQVSQLVEGPVSCEVTVDLPGGNTVTAMVTKESAENMALKTGSSVSALIKASSVLLAVN